MSTINNDYLKFLINEQIKNKNNNNDFSLLTEIGPQDVGPGSAARPDAEFRREISDEESDEDLNNLVKAIEVIDYGITALSVVVTGGIATALYAGGKQLAKQAIKGLVKDGVKKFGRKELKKKIKREAKKLSLENLRNSKLKTAWTTVKFAMTGSAIKYWEDTVEIIEIYFDLWKALIDKKRIANVTGNKARVAVVSNTTGNPVIDKLLKSFFALFTKFDASILENLSAQASAFDSGERPGYSEKKLWTLNQDFLNVVSSDEIVNVFNEGLFIEFDKYGRLNENFKEQYLKVFNFLRKSLDSNIPGFDSGIDFLMVSDKIANTSASLFSKLLRISINSDDKKIDSVHPQIFALFCTNLFNMGVTLKGNWVLSRAKNSQELSKIFSDFFAEDFSNLYDSIYNADTNKVFKLPKQNETTDNLQEQSDAGVGDAEGADIEADIPMGVSAVDSDGTKIAHNPNAEPYSREATKVNLKVNNIFSNGVDIKNIIQQIGYEIYDNEKEELELEEEIDKAFGYFSQTILLDPSGQGFGGYDKVKSCTEWMSQESQAGFREIVGKTGFGKQLLGHLMFYYQEIFIINKPAAALWEKLAKQRMHKWRVGSIRQIALSTGLFLGLAFLDPFNIWDKRKMLKTLEEARKKALEFANKQSGGTVKTADCIEVQPSDEENSKWTLTDEQNKEVIQIIHKSLEEIQIEVAQTINQTFKWSDRVYAAQQKDKKLNRQFPGASEECMIWLGRKSVRDDIVKLQREISNGLKTMLSSNFNFRIDSTNFNQFNCFLSQTSESMEQVFDLVKEADISVLTGDVPINENKNTLNSVDYLQKYLNEQEDPSTRLSPALPPKKKPPPLTWQIQGVSGDEKETGASEPQKGTSDDTQVNAAAAASNGSGLIGYYEHIKNTFGTIIDQNKAFDIVKLLDFVGYRDITIPSGETENDKQAIAESSAWIGKTRHLKEYGVGAFDRAETSIEMRSNYLKFRDEWIVPSQSSKNYKFYQNSIDHRHGALIKGSAQNLFHLREFTDAVTYNIFGISRLYGIDGIKSLSNVVGCHIQDSSGPDFYRKHKSGYGGLDIRFLENSILPKKYRGGKINLKDRVYENIFINENKIKNLNNGSTMTWTDMLSDPQGNMQHNVLTACLKYVNVAMDDGLSKITTQDLKALKVLINKETQRGQNVAAKAHLLQIIEVCLNVVELYKAWSSAIIVIDKLGKIGSKRGGEFGKEKIKEFINFYKSKKTENNKITPNQISRAWYSKEKQAIAGEQALINRFLSKVSVIITIDNTLIGRIN